jgi:hypothetical protein
LRWSSKHFWHKKPCKKAADLHPRQGNLLQRNIFTGLNETSLFKTQNRLETICKKSPLFQYASSSTKISMVSACHISTAAKKIAEKLKFSAMKL